MLLTFAVAAMAAEPPLEVGHRLQLFVDDRLPDRLEKVEFQLHPPSPREVVFRFDAPWEGSMSAYVTVLRDGDAFRLYYRGGGETTEEVTCVAFSRDAIHWERPMLGLFAFQGSRSNNIIYRGRKKAYWESHNFTPFLDANPLTDDGQRYKAIALGRFVKADGEDVKALVALVSPDGVHWERLGEAPIITTGSFDSQNVAFWDTVQHQYVCYLRDGRPTPAGGSFRGIRRATSTNFVDWTPPVWLDFGGTPAEHFYVNTIAPYFREPSLYLGFPMRFVPDRKTIGNPPRSIDGVSDAVLIASRDGLHFTRLFMEAYIRPGPDVANWGNAHGNNTPAWGLIATSPAEISLFWAEHYGGTPQLRRGTARTDGFVSLHSGYEPGEWISRPLCFEGSRLLLNYATSAVGSIRVELQDEWGTAIPGFSLEHSPEMYGDEIERSVNWDGGKALGGIAGRVIRLRFVMKDADLFSLRFCD